MTQKTVQGKVVAFVRQVRFMESSGKSIWCVSALEFTDGSELAFGVAEGEGEYGVVPVYRAPRPQQREEER